MVKTPRPSAFCVFTHYSKPFSSFNTQSWINGIFSFEIFWFLDSSSCCRLEFHLKIFIFISFFMYLKNTATRTTYVMWLVLLFYAAIIVNVNRWRYITSNILFPVTRFGPVLFCFVMLSFGRIWSRIYLKRIFNVSGAALPWLWPFCAEFACFFGTWVFSG